MKEISEEVKNQILLAAIVFAREHWSDYEDLKGSISLDVDVHFMHLCETLEDGGLAPDKF